MVNCCVYKCANRSERKIEGITFHRFPIDPARKNLWIVNMGMQNWTPSEHDRICSAHFEDKWFYATKSTRRLQAQAIPTIFSSFPFRPDSPEAGPSTIDTLPKEKLQKRLFATEHLSKEKSHKIRILKQTVRRSKKKVDTLKQYIIALKNQNLTTGKHSTFLNNVCDINGDMLEEEQHSRIKYSPSYDDVKVQIKEEIPDIPTSPSISSIECTSPPMSPEEFISLTEPIESKFHVENITDQTLITTDSFNESILASNSYLGINSENNEYTQNGHEQNESLFIENFSHSDTDSNCSLPDNKRKWLSRTRYFENCLPPDSCDQVSARKNWDLAKHTIKQQKQKIRILNQNVRRLKERNNTLKMLIKYLKENDLLTEDGHSVILAFKKK